MARHQVASRRGRRPGSAGGDVAPVGRDDVLDRMRQAVDGAVAGRGLIVLLTGEAGIGKTTVLREAARYTERTGARPAWGWGWPGEGAPGYWPWIQVLRALGLDARLSRDSLGTAADDAPASARFQLFDEVTSLLLAESRIQPVVVFLDDLHAADEPSLLLLDFLVRRLPAGAISVIGTYRGPDPGAALAAVATRATVLPLTGLPVEAVALLVADVLGEQPGAGVAADVHRRTGGNPFFVQQVSWLLKDGQEGIPPGVREALAERFAGLSAACVAALGAAAVIGRRFRADLLTRATAQAPELVAEALAEGARAGVLAEDAPGSYSFAHDLFREYAYQRLPAAERARLHLRTGLELEADRARGADVPLAELAGHYVRADPASGGAYEYSAAAAREADDRLAYEEAAHHWERVLAAAGDDPQARTETLLKLAQARWRMGAGEAAGETYLAAAGLARRESDVRGLARAALGLHALGRRIWWPPNQLVAVLSEALEAVTSAGAGDGGAAVLRLRLAASLARVLAWHGLDLPRARALAAEAVTQARAIGDLPALAACLMAQHNAIWAPGTAGERRAVAGEVAALAEETGDRELLLEARLLAATDLLELGDSAFRAELDEFFRLADATRQPRFRHAALARRAMLALLGGRFAEAERLIGQAAALGEECGEPGARDVAQDQDWNLRAGQGRLGELAGALPEMFPDPDSAQARGLRAAALLAAGDRIQAAQVAALMFESSLELLPRNHQFLLGAAFASELAAGLGLGPVAERLYQALLPFADQAVVSGAAISFRGSVAHHLGVLAAALGRAGEATAHLESALAAHERLGALPWALRSRYELARLRLAEPRHRDAAAAALAEVGREAQRLGMAGLARDAQAHAARVGAARPDSARAGGAPLVTGVFRREGALWTLSYEGVTVRMRDAKGLADLAALLAVPGREIPAADLVAAAGSGELGRADLQLGADEMLDETARRQIRQRLADLDEEIAEAEAWADPERASRARAERDALVTEVTSATGLAGRTRRLGDQPERARKGDSPPAATPRALACRAGRAGRLAAARDRLAAEDQARRDAQRAKQEAFDAAAAAAKRGGRRPGAEPPRINHNNTEPRANITDPDVRVMRNRKGYVAGYNGQLVVTAQQVIVGTMLSQHPGRPHPPAPPPGHLPPAAGRGWHRPEAAHCARRLRLRQRGELRPRRRRRPAASRAAGQRPRPPPHPHSPAGSAPGPVPGHRRARRRLHHPRGREDYRMRARTVEPVFGQLKTCQKMTVMSRRGFTACESEWLLACTAHNLRKLHRHRAER